MQQDNKLNMFERFFMWAAESKMVMGLFFAFYVIMYLFLGLIVGGQKTEMDFFTALEMMIASFILGVIQKPLVPGRANKITLLGSVLWVVISTGVTLAFSAIFGWFRLFPVWCYVVFMVCVAAGVSMMVYFYRLQFKKETQQLNKMLELFQNKQKNCQ